MTQHTVAQATTNHCPQAAPRPIECPTCNGNDAEKPCAYPSEGKAGCLRDKRLGSPLPVSVCLAV